MGGGSDNLVTIGHVTFREVSSIIFWLQTSVKVDHSLSPLLFVQHMRVNYPM